MNSQALVPTVCPAAMRNLAAPMGAVVSVVSAKRRISAILRQDAVTTALPPVPTNPVVDRMDVVDPAPFRAMARAIQRRTPAKTAHPIVKTWSVERMDVDHSAPISAGINHVTSRHKRVSDPTRHHTKALAHPREMIGISPFSYLSSVPRSRQSDCAELLLAFLLFVAWIRIQ